MNLHYICVSIVCLSMSFVMGCTSIQPFPLAARLGDTISLAVGSQDSMNVNNTTVTFTSDSDGVALDMPIRSIFNLYADKSSLLYSPSIQFFDDNFRYLHREPAQTVIVLDLPTSLPLGPGKVNVATTLQQPVGALEPGYNGAYPDLNTVDIDLEILEGAGQLSRFRYKTLFNGTLDGSLEDLEPARQALVRPPNIDTAGLWPSTFGAAEFTISMPMTDMSGTGVIDDSSVRLVTQDVSTWTGSKLQSAWRYDGNEIKVMFISPEGKMQYYEPRFSVMAETADFSSTPVITSVVYYDVQGNSVPGPAVSDYTVELLNTF